MGLFVVVIAVLICIVWYAMKGRAWLKAQPWADGFFAWIGPLETALYRKSETILMGRLLWVGGVLVTAYDSIAVFFTSLDLTPVTNRVFATIPDDLRPLAVSGFVAMIGLLINWLRKRTAKPLDQVAQEK